MSNKQAKYTLVTTTMLGLALSAKAAEGPIGYDNLFNFGLLALAAVVIIAAIVALFQLLSIMIKIQQIQIYQEAGLEDYLEKMRKPRTSLWQRLYKWSTSVVPVEKERDILMDHDYDGIKELDNSLPPWWVALFYITIAFGVIYMTYYHFAGVGMSSREAYEQEMEEAEAEVQAFLARQSNAVDENSVVMLDSDNDLAAGQQIFNTNCASCHGALGEGGIGPNLTDEFWLHGGSIVDIFKTIKYGVPEKGMIAWSSQIRPADMQRVASYVKTLQGTNPPNAKEPQGEKYIPVEEGPSADTTDTSDQLIGLAE